MRKHILLLTLTLAAAVAATPASAQVPPPSGSCGLRGFSCTSPYINWCKDVSGWQIPGCIPPHASPRD
jgi:hypothetical protein